MLNPSFLLLQVTVSAFSETFWTFSVRHEPEILCDPAGPCATCVIIAVLQDGKPLTRAQATADTQFRPGDEESYVVVDCPRMYVLVDNREYGEHTLQLVCQAPGWAAYAFTFTSCVSAEQAQGSRG